MAEYPVEKKDSLGAEPLVYPLFCDLYTMFFQKIGTYIHEAQKFPLLVGKHQALKELVGLEFGFSFGKTCFPGQALYGF